MMKLLLIGATLLLTACTAAQDAVTQTTRSSAKSVVNSVVEKRFPGVNAAPITDCIIDNASTSEIFKLAGAAVTGVDDSTIKTVVDITKRPDTTKCIAKASLGLLG